MGRLMKIKIFILPEDPDEAGLRNHLSRLNPPLPENFQNQVVDSFWRIKARVREAAINDSVLLAQTQTLSVGGHTVTLVGALEKPSFWRRILG